MKVPNILHLLYCIEILGVLLCGVESDVTPTDPWSTPDESPNTTLTTHYETTQDNSTSPASLTSTASSTTETSKSTVAPNSQSAPKYSVSPPPGPNPTTNTHSSIFYKRECLEVLMVAGGLMIACVILLFSTLILTLKVCRLSRRIKVLSSNADLISNSEYWMGTAEKNKSKSETEAKETSMLMADVSQTQEEVGNSTTKEEEETVIEDGQTGEEDKKKSGGTANSEEVSASENKETLVIGDENPSSPKLQEEAADSQSAKAVAASSSEGTEEPKDVV